MKINEVVFADRDKINTKKKTIGLTYSKGNNRAENNANPFDKLGTEEMDKDNSNTIEVPLKGGIISYNITDIKGVEVMHYFKKKWEKTHNATIDVKSKEGTKDTYNLKMDNSEEREFINRFIKKVEYVISAWISKHKQNDINFSQISILPVSSTSNFNKNFVKEELTKLNINGLSCIMVDPDLIIKDLKNVQRDEEFIKNNQYFYNNDFAKDKPEFGTVNQRVDAAIDKNRALSVVNSYIPKINHEVDVLLNFLNNNRNLTDFSPVKIRNLTNHYKTYIDLIRTCYSITYTGVDNEKHKLEHDKILNAIKYSKGPSIDSRSEKLWKMVKPYLRGIKSEIDGERYKELPLCYWKKTDFEIKTLRNSERLGLQNIYSVNSDFKQEQIEKEIDKMRGTILLIFDDNISGGATLSDVCFQCKKLGADNIIPITFGKMSESNTMNSLILNTPENGFNFSTDNNLSLYNGIKKGKRKYEKRSETMDKGKVMFYKTHQINPDSKILNILWLDDIREPYTYFSNKRNSVTWKRNNEYYSNNVFNNYNPNFIWVKNLNEFKQYILKNGIPDMISFDHDIKPDNYNGVFENGDDIAKWLVNYCHENNIELPWTFVHSANTKGGPKIQETLSGNKMIENKINNTNVIKLNENEFRKIIKESVFNILKHL